MNELVSVVIPTYNRETTVITAIESVLAQSYKNVEILVCDDFSTDHTVERVNELTREHDNVKLISRKDRKKGANAARNLGIIEAGGEYITFLDSDDILVEDSIYNRVKAFDENPDVDMVYGDMMINGKSSNFDVIQNYSQREYLMEELCLCGFIVIMVKKDIFKSVPLLDENLKSGQDDGLILELDKHGKKMLHCGQIVAEVGTKGERITTNNWNLYEGCKYKVKYYKKDIIQGKSLFRYILWKMRVLLAWTRAKARSGDHNLKSKIYEILFQVLLMIIKPFFRHIWT